MKTCNQINCLNYPCSTNCVDWTNPSCKISKYFTVKEACWLHLSHVLYTPSEIEKDNILKTAAKMDLIRDFIKYPINIVSWIRPAAYNKMVGGAPKSEHIVGNAVDWTTGQFCDDLRRLILPQLSFWGLRMEDLPGSDWVHIDRKQVDDKFRYFKP